MPKLDQAITDDLANYYHLYKLAEGMYGILRDAGMDLCGQACGGTCPLCVARERFAPRRPCVVLRTTVLEG